MADLDDDDRQERIRILHDIEHYETELARIGLPRTVAQWRERADLLRRVEPLYDVLHGIDQIAWRIRTWNAPPHTDDEQRLG